MCQTFLSAKDTSSDQVPGLIELYILVGEECERAVWHEVVLQFYVSFI